MIYFLQGKVHELTPTYAVLDVQGVGYYVGISLQTSEKLVLGQPTFLYIQQIIREDANLLFGFHNPPICLRVLLGVFPPEKFRR